MDVCDVDLILMHEAPHEALDMGILIIGPGALWNADSRYQRRAVPVLLDVIGLLTGRALVGA